MSSHLKKQAVWQSSQMSNVWRQLSQSIPPVPPGITLEGKTALVTGSNVGLGLECTRHFLKLRPSRLIMAVRSLEKGEAAALILRAEFPAAIIEVWQLDMESFVSVQAFAARCQKDLDRLDVAVLNAGVGKLRYVRVEEGCCRETTMQVNYLSTALLAVLLTPAMKPSSSSTPARLTIITSDASLGVTLEDPEGGLLDSLDRPETFDGLQQYAKSKLLITMFCARLAEVVDPSEIIINCCNPGATRNTAFMREVDSKLVRMAIGIMFSLLGRSAVDGSRAYIHSSLVLGEESHGSYTDWLVRSWPLMMYSDLGRRLGDKLWSETMEELHFAGLEGVLKGSLDRGRPQIES